MARIGYPVSILSPVTARDIADDAVLRNTRDEAGVARGLATSGLLEGAPADAGLARMRSRQGRSAALACLRRPRCRGHDGSIIRTGILGGEERQVGSSMMWSSHSSSGTSNSGTVRPCAETPASCTLSGSPVSSGCHG